MKFRKLFGVLEIGDRLQANCIVERSLRILKSFLMCRINHARANWFNELLIVLLGMRNAYKKDVGGSSAQLVFSHGK